MLVQVTKDEAEYLRENVWDVKISKTCRLKRAGKKRGKYYVEEARHVLERLEIYRMELAKNTGGISNG